MNSTAKAIINQAFVTLAAATLVAWVVGQSPGWKAWVKQQWK